MFGILNDDSPRGRNQSKDRMAKEPIKTTTAQNANLKPINTSTATSISSNETGPFHALPFSTKAAETPTNAKKSSIYHESSLANSGSETSSLLGKQTMPTSSMNNSILQPQQQQQSKINNRSSNSSSLDSMMMRNAGIQSNTGVNYKVEHLLPKLLMSMVVAFTVYIEFIWRSASHNIAIVLQISPTAPCLSVTFILLVKLKSYQ